LKGLVAGEVPRRVDWGYDKLEKTEVLTGAMTNWNRLGKAAWNRTERQKRIVAIQVETEMMK
jgi:hypothetical protein